MGLGHAPPAPARCPVTPEDLLALNASRNAAVVCQQPTCAHAARCVNGLLLYADSIISSARASSVGGTVKPSTLAVVRLMTRSNFADIPVEQPTWQRVSRTRSARPRGRLPEAQVDARRETGKFRREICACRCYWPHPSEYRSAGYGLRSSPIALPLQERRVAQRLAIFRWYGNRVEGTASRPNPYPYLLCASLTVEYAHRASAVLLRLRYEGDPVRGLKYFVHSDKPGVVELLHRGSSADRHG